MLCGPAARADMSEHALGGRVGTSLGAVEEETN